tara:strand:+ start:146 stop:1420 length:1275 start_codon:yes stop_codon:yes gene_type:complete
MCSRANPTFFRKIVYFNEDESELLFETNAPTPDGVTPLFAFLDGSGSIKVHHRELRGIAASFIHNSNADGNVGIVPKPTGRTNLISTLRAYTDQADGCDIILVTDGLENCFRGKVSLPIGDGDGDQEAEVDFGEVMDTKGVFSEDYLKHTANFLERVCNAQLYYLGIGAQAKQMANELIKKRNTHVGHVHKGASEEEILSTVLALRKRGSQQVGLPNEQRTRQTAPIFSLSEEVRGVLESLDSAVLGRVTVSSNALTISGVYTAPPAPLTAADAMARMISAEETIKDEFPHVPFKQARAAMLLAMLEMTKGPFPVALFTGKRCGVLKFENESVGRFINTIFSQLAKNGIVAKADPVGSDGQRVCFENANINVPAKSTRYTSEISAEAIRVLIDHTDFADPAASLKRKETQVHPNAKAKKARTST